MDNKKKRKKIIISYYNKLVYKKQKTIYYLIKIYYYWKKIYKTVKYYIKIYPNCQFRISDRQYKFFQSNKIIKLWKIVFIDTIYISTENSYRIIIQIYNRLNR